ncbi:MAG: hypothetical protein WCG83_05990 [Candidatus Peregrinibacteria bacterium]
MLQKTFERIKKSHLKDELDFEIITVHEYPIKLWITLVITFAVFLLLLILGIFSYTLFASDGVFWTAVLLLFTLFVGRCFVLINRWFCTFYTVTLDNIHAIKHRHIFARGGGEETLSLLYETIGSPPEFEDRYLSFLHCGVVRIHTKNTDIVTGTPIIRTFGIVPKSFHFAVLEAMKSNKLQTSGTETHEERRQRALGIKEKQSKARERVELIKTIVNPYRKHNPLKLADLLQQCNHAFHERTSEAEFVKFFMELQAIGELTNITIEGPNVYLAKENISDKQQRNTAGKKKIAEKAMGTIHSGDVIAIDPGSTNLEVAKSLCQAIPERFTDLTVVTNSIPVANVLLNWIREKKPREEQLKVYLIEGRAMPDSLAVTSDSALAYEGMTGFASLLHRLGKEQADVAFIGTSGMYANEGFAVDTDNEIQTKRDILKSSKRRVIVLDASKFASTESKTFMKFAEETGEVIVLTCFEKEHESKIESFRQLIGQYPHMHLVVA